jgi:hypothetical protein
MGLIKYVMSLMNGARLGVGAQSVGLSQAAYNEAVAYAMDRRQFGKAIVEFPAVYDLLATIKAKLQASRAILYETTRFVDVYKAYEAIENERALTKEEKLEYKEYQRLADAYTPMLKMFSSEYANQNAYDCIQVHGGSGFMKDYACERLYRDARILTIYEGTSQLQVVAAIRHVTTGTYLKQIRGYEAAEIKPEFNALREKLKAMTDKYEAAVKFVTDLKDNEALDFLARKLVEMAGHIIMGYLLIIDASRDDKGQFNESANVYVLFGEAEVEKHAKYIAGFDKENLSFFRH